MSKNNEIKNVLLRTVIKLYEGSYPTQNVKLAHKAKKVLGSRFLSVERDDESTIEPLVRRNLDDFYKSANGVEIIDFSKSSTFFPSRTESFYSFERVAEMAKNSPYVTLEDFFDYVKTRPDKEKFASWLWYTSTDEYREMGFHRFFGLENLEGMKENLLLKIEETVNDSTKKGFRLLYTTKRVWDLVNPYSPDKKEFDPSLYEGVKGGYISNSANGILHMYQKRFGKIQDRVERYASPEKFEEFCKKYNVKKQGDISLDSDSEEKKEFALKYGIISGMNFRKTYSEELIKRVFSTNNYGQKGIDLDMCVKMQSDLNSGMLVKDVAAKYGISQQSVVKKLKEKGLEYKSKNDILKSIDPEIVRDLLLNKGMDFRGAAKDLGVSPNTIARIVKRNNIPYRRGDFNKLKEEEIKKFVDEGFTYSRIAQILGVNQVTISHFCKEKGIIGKRVKSSTKLTPISEEQRKEILTLIKEGISISQVSSLVGRNRKCIKSIILKEGIEYNPKTGPKLKI